MSRAPEPAPPLISVVMVSYGAPELTRRALAELAAHLDAAYEVILVDNGSDARTRRALSELAGPRLVLNPGNRGFGPASNQGAALARGRYLLLLNTDAFLHPGWFPPLEAALMSRGVGAVVPKLLNEDGSLQEAGVLFAQDGTVNVYGDGEPAEDPRFTFRRYIDAGSAAAMLMHRDLFLELGGFDDRYAPAYYEDADLCMRIAAVGRRILYEPAAVATHVRYGSGDREQARVLSERNRGQFVERWAGHLRGRPRSFARPSPQAALTARDAGAWPHILALPRRGEPSTGPGFGERGLAELLLEYWPEARLSWAGEGPEGAGVGLNLNPWVESLPAKGASWLDDRLFHYDVILLDGPVDPVTAAVLDRTQPQAVRMDLTALGDGAAGSPARALPRALARAGILSAAALARVAPAA